MRGNRSTACFDNALEFSPWAHSLPHAMMMLIPEAWAGNPLMDEDPRAFDDTMRLMEPWTPCSDSPMAA